VAVGGSSLLSHDQVGGLGLGVGVPVPVIGEGLVLPLAHGPGQSRQLGNLYLIGPVVEHLKSSMGLQGTLGPIHVSQQLLSSPGTADFVPAVTITVVESDADPFFLLVGEPFPSSEGETPDPVEGITRTGAISPSL
jgi:hypothetical protein